MSYDEKTDHMEWKDEFSWFVISIVLGLLLSFLFIYFEKFPDANKIVVCAICCSASYLLSILVRAQSHRGKVLTGKTGAKEKHLKYIFPFVGIGIGLIIVLTN